MRKFAIVISTLLALALPALRAQDNAYDIDNVCYEYFMMCESLVEDTNSTAFEMAADALIRRANEVGDRKAIAIHATVILKRTIRFARLADDRRAANEAVERQRRETMETARETGYMQYFYYAYTLTQTYYVNTRQEIHAQRLLTEMMENSYKDNDEYGIWQSEGYMATLYLRQNDLISARKHLLNVIEIYETSTNETIRRQSITRQCCDLADTYQLGADSARIFYNKAEIYSRTHGDTLRYTYYKAQLAALDHRKDEYVSYRDFCLSDPAFAPTIRGGDILFEGADAIIAGLDTQNIAPLAQELSQRRQWLFLRDLAISYGREKTAAWLGTWIIFTLYGDISLLNSLKMEEMSAVMQTGHLQNVIDHQKHIMAWMWGAIGLLLAGLIVSLTILITRNNKTNHIQ